MKRVVTSESDDRCLKRAHSSLFSIATLVDDDPNAEALTSLIGGRQSSSDLLLMDNGMEEENNDVDASETYSSLKAGLVTAPLDCSSGDDLSPPLPDDAASSSCSSSEIVEGDERQESNDDVICKTVEQNSAGMEQTVLSGSDKLSPVAKEDEHDKIIPATKVRTVSTECLLQEKQRQQPIKSNKDNCTGLVFESGSKHFDRHNRFHKERPIRVTSVHDYLSKAKPSPEADDNEKTIFERCHLLDCHDGEKDCGDDMKKKSAEDLWLDDHDYLRVHLPGYMQRLDRISKCNCHNRLDIEAEQFKSIYFTNDSVLEAKAAASSLCKLVSRVANGNLDNGFAVIRPPGHHAEPALAGGYCVINNVAVAAAYAREKLGMEKILIVDWDVHHGNGTQRCFIDNPNILYFSAHRYHGGNFFPFLQQGGPSSVGSGAGEGFNINVGWNEKKMGDDEYLVLWEKLLIPVAQEFKPDLVLVSAGFDAARGDMGECDITPEMFARLTRRLKTLANGKVVCALEGGYVRSVLCKCIESVLGSLLDANSNEKCEEELQRFHKAVGENDMLDCINSSAAKSIRETIKMHSKYWNCFK